MTEPDDTLVTIADVLSGRAQLATPMKITAAQRLYYNYRFHRPSFEREIGGLGMPRPSRDFRSERERCHDPD